MLLERCRRALSKKVTKNKIFFYHGFEINDEIFQALVKFSDRAPSYYNKIIKVTFGERPVADCLFFNIHY